MNRMNMPPVAPAPAVALPPVVQTQPQPSMMGKFLFFIVVLAILGAIVGGSIWMSRRNARIEEEERRKRMPPPPPPFPASPAPFK